MTGHTHTAGRHTSDQHGIKSGIDPILVGQVVGEHAQRTAPQDTDHQSDHTQLKP